MPHESRRVFPERGKTLRYRLMGHTMKNVSPLLLSVILTATVVAVPSFAQSSLSLPGCEPAPELRRILDEKLNEEALEKMKTSDRESLQRQVYEELIAKFPREVDPYNRLIVDAHCGPRQVSDPAGEVSQTSGPKSE